MNRVARLLATLSIAVLAGCASAPEREINFLASAMTKLSAAVDATVRFRRPPDDIAEAELLRLSVAHDPSLLVPFDGMTLRVLRAVRDSAVLLCEPNAGKALLEDAGCTAKLDRHRWNSGATSCEFTLDVKEVCARQDARPDVHLRPQRSARSPSSAGERDGGRVFAGIPQSGS